MWMERITFLFNKGQTVEYIYTINNNKISCLRVCVCKSCRNPGMLDPSILDRGPICRQFPLNVEIVFKLGKIFCKYGFCR